MAVPAAGDLTSSPPPSPRSSSDPGLAPDSRASPPDLLVWIRYQMVQLPGFLPHRVRHKPDQHPGVRTQWSPTCRRCRCRSGRSPSPRLSRGTSYSRRYEGGYVGRCFLVGYVFPRDAVGEDHLPRRRARRSR